jgi:uncharacterized protein
MMDYAEINNYIVNYLRPYNPEKIGIFGSFSRKDENPESDIDILVKFRDTLTLLDMAKIHRELSQLLGREVDLITEASLKNERLKQYIYKDLKVIYGIDERRQDLY